MEKRVRFKSKLLPWLLLAPQLAVILVFFFLPAGQALLQSVQRQDAFGFSTEFVGLANFVALFNDESYLDSFRITAVFSLLVAGFGLAISLLLAVFADRIIKGADVLQDDAGVAVRRGAGGRRRAVALHVLAQRRRARLLAAPGRRGLEPPAEQRPGDGADRHGGRLEADLLQLPVLPGRPAVDSRSR